MKRSTRCFAVPVDLKVMLRLYVNISIFQEFSIPYTSPVFNALNADIICIVLLEKSENGVQQEHSVLQTLGFY
jgi:phenylalanine-4-hydroxylase